MATRPIVDTLRELRNGVFLDEASEALAEVVRAVTRTGRAGALKLTLTIKPAARGTVSTVIVDADVQQKLPPADREITMFFPTADGNLSRNDPKQPDMFPRIVITRSDPVADVPADVDPETGEVLHRA